MGELVTNLVRDATILREYFDVIWAVDHHRTHYPSNVIVEVCASIAYAAVGEHSRAMAVLASALEHGRDAHEIATLTRDLLGPRFRPKGPSAEGLLQAIANVVSEAHVRKARPGRGN